ncbi:ATP synthase subunit e, mitochondrial [Wickerhamiella sorbophila]|uniref:ATP synthase F(0) complex subunit e, mitochondrial n=1 Tax=Wickerhamiella sorbophila TaxID=45607 RepID=A0A2T0FME4_9ASCO|nr:ATP synthase subunit e, mitochondrial [Wickerhamiella sorbophila]PRT56145.1 ATP synthase subunit e, mitochondrial [Wickerhamiella sorbophila]
MASPIFNVARWTFFASGIVYGFVHNSKLSGEAKAKEAQAEFDHKAKLIEQARAEWRKLHPKKESATASLDLENPNFDIAKYIEQSVEQLKA